MAGILDLLEVHMSEVLYQLVYLQKGMLSATPDAHGVQSASDPLCITLSLRGIAIPYKRNSEALEWTRGL